MLPRFISRTAILAACILSLGLARAVAQTGDPIDWKRAQQIHQKFVRGEKLSEEEQHYHDRAAKGTAGQVQAGQPAPAGKTAHGAEAVVRHDRPGPLQGRRRRLVRRRQERTTPAAPSGGTSGGQGDPAARRPGQACWRRQDRVHLHRHVQHDPGVLGVRADWRMPIPTSRRRSSSSMGPKAA